MKLNITLVLFVILFTVILNSIFRGIIPFLRIGNIGFTIVFTLFSISHSTSAIGWKRTFAFFITSAFISWIYEEIGVRTGLIYGSYVYSDMLGPKLGNVPIVVPLAWFMMIYPSWLIAGTLLGSFSKVEIWKAILTRSFVAAVVMTMWDVVMEPSMAARGNWIWLDRGSYFGVPMQNFVGWILTTFTVYLVTELIFLRSKDDTKNNSSLVFLSLPIIVYTVYSIIYMGPRFPESVNPLRIVTFFTMTFAGLLSLIRLLLNKDAAYPFDRK